MICTQGKLTPKLNQLKIKIAIGIRGPIEPGTYELENKKTVVVGYPEWVHLPTGPIHLPQSLSTVFEITWNDEGGGVTQQLQSKSFDRLFPLHEVLSLISEFIIAFKLPHVGNRDGLGLRTIGIADTLFYSWFVNNTQTDFFNIGMKNYAGNNAWFGVEPTDTLPQTKLALPYIGNNTAPEARRYIRCYELFEHGFYSEAFIVAFAIFDDLVRRMMDDLLLKSGVVKKKEREKKLRDVTGYRLKTYLGPMLEDLSGYRISGLWEFADDALLWINNTRNQIAHAGEHVDYSKAAHCIFGCLKLIVVLRDVGLLSIDIGVDFFRYAKITAAWTKNPPNWVPSGQRAESFDYET